ncbi:UNKNOWN [Stylonychia lemnae]|uniref:Transmembrane protein n=1 Tax=Stylonychia lemnae TaxID=5949 RepID=A0A078AIM9_STYLE|nr:UNKNOWN [Stylonychia lemnae]|eukprot:CDW80668.1 UNKNOWN [Stylonychia lemnae]
MNQKSDLEQQELEDKKEFDDQNQQQHRQSSAQLQLMQYRQMMQQRLSKQNIQGSEDSSGQSKNSAQNQSISNNQNNLTSSAQNNITTNPLLSKLNKQQNFSNNNGKYKQEINGSSQDYNPYLHGSQNNLKREENNSPPPALVPPEQIKVEHIPIKISYDFTKKSKNMKLLNEGQLDNFEYSERCDSKIEEGDLKKLEIELKKNAMGNGNNNGNQLGSIVDEEGNVIRPYDNQQVDQLIADEGYQPLLNQNSIHRIVYNFSLDNQRPSVEERQYLRGMIRRTNQGRFDILCIKDLDKQFLFLFGLTLLLSIFILIFALFQNIIERLAIQDA